MIYKYFSFEIIVINYIMNHVNVKLHSTVMIRFINNHPLKKK